MNRPEAICRICQAPIIFAVVSNKEGRPSGPMPLNPDPDPAGNVAVYQDGTGRRIGRVLGNSQPLGYEHIYMPHAATCVHPQVQQARDGITSLTEYRRNQRGKRRTQTSRQPPGRTTRNRKTP